MKYLSILFIFLTTASLVACSNAEKNADELNDKKSETDISKTWHRFLEIIASADKDAFMSIAANEIYCYLCLENTEDEQLILDSLRDTNENAYDIIYDSLVYVSIDSFIQRDFDIIFNSDFIKTLQSQKTQFFETNADEYDFYQVLVTTTPPTTDFEGAQHNFQFKKINGEWKLNEIGTIP